MQAVILAAGRGKRMSHLTNDTPKSLLKISGKNLIEWKIERLPDYIKEVVIVVGYLGQQIKDYFGNYYMGRKITYVDQDEPAGTGAALFKVKDLLKDEFIVMMGDDIYSKSNIEEISSLDWAILIEKTKERKKGAKLIISDKGLLIDVLEKSDLDEGDLNNAGMYALRKEIFEYPLVKIGNGEFGLPQTLVKVAADFPVKIIEARDWIQLTSPEDIEKAEKILGIN